MAIEWAGLGPGVLLALDRESAVPLRAQLEQALRETIRPGRLASGERLPSSRALADHGVRRVAIEDPGDRDYLVICGGLGIEAVAVAIDDRGIDVDGLAASGARAVILTPTHQFPTGTALAPERRHALVTWAKQRAATIIEDDYDARHARSRPRGADPHDRERGGAGGRDHARRRHDRTHGLESLRDGRRRGAAGDAYRGVLLAPHRVAVGCVARHRRGRGSDPGRGRRGRVRAGRGRRKPGSAGGGDALAGVDGSAASPSAPGGTTSAGSARRRRRVLVGSSGAPRAAATR